MKEYIPRSNPGLQAVFEAADALGRLQDPPVPPLHVIANACAVSIQAVCKWRHVPAHHVLCLEALTGVSRFQQRPDIFGAPPIRPPTKAKARPKLRRPQKSEAVA